MTCQRVHELLDGDLSAQQAAATREHVEQCADCAAFLAEWQGLADQVRRVDRTPEEDWEPTPASAGKLRSALPQRRAWSVRLLVPTALLSGAALLVLWAVRVPTVDPSETMPLASVSGANPGLSELGRGDVLETPAAEEMVVDWGEHRLAMSAGTRFTVRRAQRAKVALDMTTGKLFVHAAHTGTDFEMTIALRAAEVVVVGTRFSVATGGDHDEVDVSEGAVEVRTDSRSHRLEAGQGARVDAGGAISIVRLAAERAHTIDAALGVEAPSPSDSNGATVSERPHPTPSGSKSRSSSALRAPERDLRGWKQAILTGKAAEIEAELVAYLRSKPRDTDVLNLLADAQRKQEAWGRALTTYETLTGLGSPAARARAHFMMATLYQDEMAAPNEAIEHLRRFLAGRGAMGLQAPARLRLGRALIAAGRDAEARKVLEKLVTDHPDHAAAGVARDLLGVRPSPTE